jgi:uncharacterized DUF497 family protein
VDFEWDDEKALSNKTKHGITFEETIAVFADEDLMVLNASRPADGEERFKAVGRIEGRLFIVVYAQRGEGLRLISARRANSKEKRSYGDREGKA